MGLEGKNEFSVLGKLQTTKLTKRGCVEGEKRVKMATALEQVF
jgi:hypothetical protein